MVAALIIVVLALGMAALFWYGLRGRSNERPTLGSNSPYPPGLLGGAVIGEDEEFRDEVDEELARVKRRRHRDPGL